MKNFTRISGALLALASPVLATDWTVGPGQSIQAAINSAWDGDRILVQAGTYSEVLDLLGKQLELIGVDGAQATVIDGNGLGNAIIVAESVPLGTRVEGFTLTRGAGRPFPSSYGFDYYGGGIWAGEGALLEVVECVITNNAWGTGTFAGGIYSGGTGTHVDVLRCEISNNRAWASGGATLCDYYATMLLEQCTVYGNSSDNFFGHQGGVSMANYGQAWVTHSIVWANEGDDIGSFGYPYSVGTAAYVDYTDVEGGYSGMGNFELNPLFANPGSGDFALLPGSPCIDAGDPAFPLDCDGTLADLGAVLPPCGGGSRASCVQQPGILGLNPMDCTCVNMPVMGTNWTPAIDTTPSVGTTTIATLLTIGMGGQSLGLSAFGYELMTLPPYVYEPAMGSHTIPIPTDPAMIGWVGHAQGARLETTFGVGFFVVLTNGLDVVTNL